MTGPLRIGLVGCGRLAEAGYVPALRIARGVRLAAVADPDPVRAARVAGGLPRHPHAGALLAAGGVDALVLATPAHAHLADARLAAERGLPVLVEKPPAPDAAGAAALAELVPRPWIGFNRRFEDGPAGVRERVPAAAGLRLDIRLAYLRERWRPHAVDDDVLLDLGPHAVDLVRWIGRAEPTAVRARRLGPRRASLELALGEGRARVELANRRPHQELVEVRDASGRLLARHRAGGVRRTLPGAFRRRPARGPHPLARSLAAQLEAFARAVRGGSRPWPADPADGVAAMGAIAAARRSAAARGAWRAVEAG